MLLLAVLFQALLVFELLVAIFECTLELVFLCFVVNIHVHFQVGSAGKLLNAVFAFERLLPCVCSHVSSEVGGLGKGLLTVFVFTDKWFGLLMG